MELKARDILSQLLNDLSRTIHASCTVQAMFGSAALL